MNNLLVYGRMRLGNEIIEGGKLFHVTTSVIFLEDVQVQQNVNVAKKTIYETKCDIFKNVINMYAHAIHLNICDMIHFNKPHSLIVDLRTVH